MQGTGIGEAAWRCRGRVGCGLALAGGARSRRDVGANDDTGKYAADAGASFYARDGGARPAPDGRHRALAAERPARRSRSGRSSTVTVAAARAAGLDVVFATYPYPPREVEAGLAPPEAFGAWLSALAQRYPEVRQFVVGNEPNQPAFWRPQFANGRAALGGRPSGRSSRRATTR